MTSKTLYYLLIISMLLTSCAKKENTVTELETQEGSEYIYLTKQQFESENMLLGQMSLQPFEVMVNVTGIIDVPPQNKANISTFIGGYVTKTSLLVGDRVKKGQLLVTLENTEYVELQQQYLEVSQQLNFLKNEFERQKTLFEENISSQKNYLQAESNYKSSLAHFSGLKKKLQMLNINPKRVEQGEFTSTINLYSPIAANVSKVNVSNGSFVSPNDVIMELVDTDHIHLELSVFEKDIINIKKGQKIKFEIPEASNEIYNAEVHLVGTTIDQDTRRVNVHGHLEDENKSFIVGMFVEANIITDAQKKMALPNTAIQEIDGKYYILVVDTQNNEGYTLRPMLIEIGSMNEQYSSVLNKENLEGKTVLLKGGANLLNEENLELN